MSRLFQGVNFTVDEDFTMEVIEDDPTSVIDLTEETPQPVQCKCGCEITKIVCCLKINTDPKPEEKPLSVQPVVKLEPPKIDPDEDNPLVIDEGVTKLEFNQGEYRQFIRKDTKNSAPKENDSSNLDETTRSVIRSHKESVMNGSVRGVFKCPACPYTTTKSTIFITHLDAHLELRDFYKCEHCNFVAFYKNQLSCHKAKCGGSKTFSCSKCSFVTVKYKYLTKHKKRHEKGFKLRCGQCDFTTEEKNLLREHTDKVHRFKFKCEECEYKTALKTHWERHMKKHETKVKVKVMKRTVIKCDLCDYESLFKGNVLRHRITHLEQASVESGQ